MLCCCGRSKRFTVRCLAISMALLSVIFEPDDEPPELLLEQPATQPMQINRQANTNNKDVNLFKIISPSLYWLPLDFSKVIVFSCTWIFSPLDSANFAIADLWVKYDISFGIARPVSLLYCFSDREKSVEDSNISAILEKSIDGIFTLLSRT